MTEQTSQKMNVLQSLAFIHQKLLTVQFYPEEFKQADAALKIVAQMASELDSQLKAEMESVPQPTEEATTNE